MNRILLFLIFLPTLTTRAQSDTASIRKHLTVLTKTNLFRNHENTDQLDETAAYIYAAFSKYADTVYYQTYKIGSREYRNVIASFGTAFPQRIVVGAHYDVCGNQEGADDNASGTTGLLELARLLDTVRTGQRIDLVAYTLEEPPYFNSKNMGSYVHAQSLVRDSASVTGMVCLEMIGYFNETKHTQDYPIKLLKWFYGSRGNYITLVNKMRPGSFARSFTRKYRHRSTLTAKQFKGPVSLPGIDFSDHRNYWNAGISAVMITDTAFYRNKNYHEPTDTMDKLDTVRMAQVIDALFVTLCTF